MKQLTSVICYFFNSILWLEHVYVYGIQTLEGGPSFSPEPVDNM